MCRFWPLLLLLVTAVFASSRRPEPQSVWTVSAYKKQKLYDSFVPSSRLPDVDLDGHEYTEALNHLMLPTHLTDEANEPFLASTTYPANGIVVPCLPCSAANIPTATDKEMLICCWSEEAASEFKMTEEEWELLTTMSITPLDHALAMLSSKETILSSSCEQFLDRNWPDDPSPPAAHTQIALKARECLAVAVFHDNVRLVEEAIKCQVNLNLPIYDKRNDIYRSYLIIAILSPRLNLDIVRLLIAAGADVNRPDSQGFAPIHWACRINNCALIALLAAAKADMNLPTGSCPFMLPIHVAARYESFAVLESLLRDCNVTVNGLDGISRHVLDYIFMYAPQADNLSAVDEILERGCVLLTEEQVVTLAHQLMAPDKFPFFKALTCHLSMRPSHLPVLQQLLLTAIAEGHLEAFKRLIKLDVPVTFVSHAARGAMLQMPLHAAILANNLQMLNLLLAGGATVNVSTMMHLSPLLQEALMQKCAESSDWLNVIMCAIAAGNVEMVCKIVDNHRLLRLAWSIKDMTLVVNLAKACGNQEIVRLVRHLADRLI